jgi:hypothetical protein
MVFQGSVLAFSENCSDVSEKNNDVS